MLPQALAVLYFVRGEACLLRLTSLSLTHTQGQSLLDPAHLPVGDCPDTIDGVPACCPLSLITLLCVGSNVSISSVVINAFCDMSELGCEFCPHNDS